MEHVTPQLKDFIVSYCSKHKMREIDAASLALHTSIDLDLDIVDIEIDLFIDDFAAHFRIDTSKFTWYKYGYPTGSSKVTILKIAIWVQAPVGETRGREMVYAKAENKHLTARYANRQAFIKHIYFITFSLRPHHRINQEYAYFQKIFISAFAAC